jgi:hydrogenase maturation protease
MICVIGIGQTLRGDDEAGLVAVQLWNDTLQREEWGSNIVVRFAESPGIGLLSLLEGSDAAVLVDAVQSGAKPGTLHQLCENDLEAFMTGAGSAHGWGVAETLALGRQMCLDTLPPTIRVIGIEVGRVEVGTGLSPEVTSALTAAAVLISKTVEELFANQMD